MEKKKKAAAAVSAVMQYIKEQESTGQRASVLISADLYRQLNMLYRNLSLLFQ